MLKIQEFNNRTSSKVLLHDGVLFSFTTHVISVSKKRRSEIGHAGEDHKIKARRRGNPVAESLRAISKERETDIDDNDDPRIAGKMRTAERWDTIAFACKCQAPRGKCFCAIKVL